MAKLRRLNTSAAGVLDLVVSMVILRLLIEFGRNYKRVDLLRIALLALQIAIALVAAGLVKYDLFSRV